MHYRSRWRIEFEGNTIERHRSLPTALQAARIIAEFNRPSQVKVINGNGGKGQESTITFD